MAKITLVCVKCVSPVEPTLYVHCVINFQWSYNYLTNKILFQGSRGVIGQMGAMGPKGNHVSFNFGFLMIYTNECISFATKNL